MFVEIILLVTLLCFIWKIYQTGKGDKTRPPGPFQWPIVGNLIDIIKAHPTHPDIALNNLANKYGDFMSLKFGVHDAVIISSYEAFKDLFNRDEFADRYQGFGFIPDRSFHSPNSHGIIFQNGPKWRQLRNYSLRTLREFGLNKTTSMEVFIELEINEFMEEFRALLKSESSPGITTIKPSVFSLSFVSILWSSVGGNRFPHSDKKLQHINKLNDTVVESMNYDNIALAYPFLRHWLPGITGYNNQMKVFAEIQEFMRELIREVQQKYEKRGGPLEAEPECYIEHFLQSMATENEKDDTPFTENQLIMTLKDLFLAGTESSSNNFCYMILYMVLYPEIQTRVQNEIYSVFGIENRPLSTKDISKLPYTEATFLEIMRIAVVAPFPPARSTTEDYTYKGYVIKKGTCVMMNIRSILHSKSWGDPEKFRPERFLDETKTFVLPEQRDNMLAFGYGKRVCLSENLARETMFAYFTTFLQHYRMKIPDGEPTPSTFPPPNCSLRPHNFKVEFIPRI